MTAAHVDEVRAAAYEIPTDAPGDGHVESDGTLEWSSTVLVVVEVDAGGVTGLGYTYAHPSAVAIVDDKLAPAIGGGDVAAPRAMWDAMRRACRNLGASGLVAMAISAVDVALWDLRSRLAGTSLAAALGAAHDRVPIYGSGGFTSYDDDTLANQLSGWVEEGIPRVKLKIGRDPHRDSHRLDVARKAIGDATALYTDANGAYGARAAIEWAARLRQEHDVVWFEEPVSSDDLDGLRRVRDAAPGGLDITAGEYCWNPFDAERMLVAGAVDCLQLDVTRCLGITGFLDAAALATSRHIPVSAHCAPQLSAHVSAAVPDLRPLEWFHDHVRIERMAFDGALSPVDGVLTPDRDRPGHGLTFKRSDLDRFRVA